MTDETPIDETTGGLDRRSLIKRGAIVGGALVWTTPLVQAVASPAFGVTPSDDDGGGVGDPVCIDGRTTDTFFIKFNTDNPTMPEFSLGNGAQCTPDGFAAATKGFPAGVDASDFVFTVQPKTPTGQTATITLPDGFTVNDGSVKAGSGVDADADLEGCFNDDKVTITQVGNVVTIQTTNTDGGGNNNPGISFVALVFMGCVLEP